MKKRIAPFIAVTAILSAVFLMSGCSTSSPPALNTPAAETPAPVNVVISELMASNKATVADGDGNFSDWLELHNQGENSVELEGFILSDGEASWTLPELLLDPGEYRLLFCSEAGGDALTVPFSLSKNGETISLRYADGAVLDSIEYTSASADVSLVRCGQGGLCDAEYPTPGYENSETGYDGFQSARAAGALQINEVMSYNSWYPADDREYYDWVELKNVSSEPLLLSDYYVSDEDDDLLLYRLPELTVEPGGLFVLQCVDANASGYAFAAAPFGVNSSGDALYISRSDGTLSDYTPVAGLKYGGSYGRMAGHEGFFFFDEPSPSEENTGGARLISSKPVADTQQGVYNEISSLKVTLSGSDEIRYTLDGSAPTEDSPLYTKPLILSSTAVIRCVGTDKGKLPSEAASFSYIINEEHELPVVSLTVDPADMYDKGTGIYANPTEDWERMASVALFDGENGFAIDCGLKIHGATSREAQQKKSFKLKFKDRYDGQLQYDLFENGVTSFSSILLRAAQESTQSSHVRDIVMHELAQECYDGLPTQDYKFSVLYLNGEYWGIYAIREAHSEEHYANHYGYNADSVTMTQGEWDPASPLADAFTYARDFAHGEITDPEADYDYISSLLDVDNVITWQIIESYSGNIDINPPNVRFYCSSQDRIARYALVDLDLGLFTSGTYGLSITTGYAYSYFINYLCYNPLFRTRVLEKLSEYLSGPLSDENVLGKLDSIAAEIRSEIPRDAERWDYDAEVWERDLGYIKGRISANGGMARRFALSAQDFLYIDYNEWNQYFSEYD